jgi:hypothetical protein
VNTQHNCSEHNCGTEKTRHVYQERERTDQTRPVVVHRAPADVVLNTAQMRDAIHVQKFRHRSVSLDADQIITASAAREVIAQKVLRKQAETVPASTMPVAGMQHVGLPQRLAALQGSLHASTSRS